MNPIWAYVKQVEPHLPAARRMQVAGALYARLKAKKEALDTSLGRKASEGEIADLLRAEGEPADVAARISQGPHEHELVTRYLASVERRLPQANVLDVLAELREAIASAVEAKEETLGRALSDDEIAAVLKAYGHPVVVASKYAGHDYVIGPKYYPWFWHVQRLAVGLAVAITFGVVAIRALGSEEPVTAALRGMGGALQAAIWAFGVVTVLFVAAERTKFDMGWAEKWDPKHLPREQMRQPKGLFETAFTLVFDIIFLLWWVKIVQFPNEIPMRDGASAAITFSPAWEMIYWPVLVLGVGVMVVHLADLVRPAWSPLRSVLSIAGHTVGLGILWVLYRSQPLIVATPTAGADPEEVARVFKLVDGIVTVSMGVTALIWAATIGVEVWRLWRSMRPRMEALA